MVTSAEEDEEAWLENSALLLLALLLLAAAFRLGGPLFLGAMNEGERVRVEAHSFAQFFLLVFFTFLTRDMILTLLSFFAKISDPLAKNTEAPQIMALCLSLYGWSRQSIVHP